MRRSFGTAFLAILTASSLTAAAVAQDASAPSAGAPAAPPTTPPTDVAPPAVAAPAPAPAPAAAPSSAGSQPTTELQEIVVTATRHAEALSKVPISVSAYTQETLDIKGAKDISDVVRFTPGIQIDNDGTNSISIRGISSSAGAATTGIYIDDTPIQMRILGFNADETLPKTFDLDRVEVLRGPQGTLFGAGAEGGAVRYIMAQPNMNKEDVYARSEVATTKGGDPSYEAGIAGGAPLIDNVLGFRASIWYRRDGGWIDRVNPYTMQTVDADTNYTNSFAARLAAKWAVNDSVTITPSVFYQDRAVHDITLYMPSISNPSSDTFRSEEPDQRAEPDNFILPALKVESELGGASFISNTSYYSRHELSGYSGTIYNLGYYQTFNNPSQFPYYPTPYYPFIDGNGLHLPASMQNYHAPATVSNVQKSFAQEFRLQSPDDPNAKLQWTTGLFFTVNRQRSVEEIFDPMFNQFFQTMFGVTPAENLANFGEALLPNGDSYYNWDNNRDKQLALFGEATYSITEQWKITAGARWSKVNQDFSHFADGPQNFGPQSGGGTSSERPFTPKLGVSYQADKNDLYYATYAKGYRIGGANPPIQVVPCATDLANIGMTAAPDSYKSDTTNSYEVGAKNKIADNLRIASSLYYIKWKGIQQNVYLPDCGFQFITNFGDAVSKGGDVQIDWNATQALSFEFTAGRTDARYVNNAGGGTGAAPIALAGDAVEGQAYGPAPPWTASLGVQYDFLAMDHKSFVRVDYEYEGRSNTPTATEDPHSGIYDQFVYTPQAYSFVSLRAGSNFGKWNVSAFCDNLLNTHPSILDSSDAHSVLDTYNANPPSVLMTAYTLRPRTVGLTMTYHM